METNTDTETTRKPRSEVAVRRPITDDESICESIFTAVASAEGCSILELDPLAETIDTDALNALFLRASGTTGRDCRFSTPATRSSSATR